jgi:hypothetical protein
MFVYVLKAKNNRVETAIQFAPLIIAALEAPLLQRLLVIELPI